MTDRNRELVPGSWSLVRESADQRPQCRRMHDILNTRVSAEERYFLKDDYACVFLQTWTNAPSRATPACVQSTPTVSTRWAATSVSARKDFNGRRPRAKVML